MNFKVIAGLAVLGLGMLFVLPSMASGIQARQSAPADPGQKIQGATSGVGDMVSTYLPGLSLETFAPCAVAAFLAMLFWKKFPVLRYVLLGGAVVYLALNFTGRL